jgi:hypothetical protein
MSRRTGHFFGINESLLSSAMAAVVFSLLSAQPLTIVGVTGLISLFNYTIYDIISVYDVSIYPQFMAWTGIWAAIFHWAVAIFNVCDYMRYVTDFSSEAFGMYVGIIYISTSPPCLPAMCSGRPDSTPDWRRQRSKQERLHGMEGHPATRADLPFPCQYTKHL